MIGVGGRRVASDRDDGGLLELDAVKRAPAGEHDPASGFKEWFHFCVRLSDGHLIVNFSLLDRVSGRRAWTDAFVTVLSSWPTWRGFVRRFPLEEVRARHGEIDLQFGGNRLCYRAGTFTLAVVDRRLRLSAVLVPQARPTLSHLGLGAASALDWVIVPRLEASGSIEVDGLSAGLDRAPTYHDHNWGRFRWGADLAWEWGFVLPSDRDCPWAIVFSRMLASGSAHTSSQGILVWHGADYVRTFHDAEVSVIREGSHRQSRALTLPPACALLAPGAASGVPAGLVLRASGLDDHLDLGFAAESYARIVIPSETHSFEHIVLNEVAGRATVNGRIGEQAMAFEAPAIVEFVRGA